MITTKDQSIDVNGSHLMSFKLQLLPFITELKGLFMMIVVGDVGRLDADDEILPLVSG